MSVREKEDRYVAAELCAVGVNVSSVYDLVNSKKRYREAIPVLVRLLDEVSDESIREGIVRALTTKDARGVADSALLREFRKPSAGKLFRWAVGNALSVVASDKDFDEIAKLVTDPSFGKAREMLAVALGNMKSPRASELAVQLLEDDEMAGHAIIALGKIGDPATRRAVEPFLTHDKAWIRKEAQRTLTKLDKAST